MSVEWLQPAAWWGVTLVVLPILIHLLARHRTRRLRFPSLRFVPSAEIAALRRRVLANWPLLLVRILVLVAAAAAVAAPVFVSDARRETWDQRVARAVVVTSPDDAAIRALATEEAATSFASAEFTAPLLADALREAREWLRTQPPAAREIVVVGDLREGMLSANEIARIPGYAGVRFLPVAEITEAGTRQWQALGETVSRTAGVYAVHVTPEVDGTRARYVVTREPLPPVLELVTAPADEQFAAALLRAVLREGVVVGQDADRRIRISFQGAGTPAAGAPPSQPWMREVLERTPEARGNEDEGVLNLAIDLAVTDPRAPEIVAGVLGAAFADARSRVEVRRIVPATLAAWSRPPGGSPPGVRPADEGDRRWLWGAVLALLAVEQVLRRRRAA